MDATLEPPTKKDEGGTVNPSLTLTQETLTFVQNETQCMPLTICLELPHLLAIQLLPRLEQSASWSQPEKKKTASSTSSWTRCMDSPFGSDRTQSFMPGALTDTQTLQEISRSQKLSSPTHSRLPPLQHFPRGSPGPLHKTDQHPYLPIYHLKMHSSELARDQ